MTKQPFGHTEHDRKTQVKFRVSESIVEQFDKMIEGDEYESRSDALRVLMKREIGTSEEQAAPRDPPVEPDMRDAYLRLISLASADGVVSHEIATQELAVTQQIPERLVERRLLSHLRERGYLAQLTNESASDRAWIVRGLDS